MTDPSRLNGATGKLLKEGLRKGWQRLTAQRRALLELLSRCAISEDQALRLYDSTARAEAGIEADDKGLLANPYRLFEDDRANADPIAFGAVDRGLFPDEALRQEFPLGAESRIDDPADQRRVRALTADLLEAAAIQGHTLLPRSWLIRRARERALQPPCPLGENVLAACEDTFAPLVLTAKTKTGEPAYQVDRLAHCREIIRREVGAARRDEPHQSVQDWRQLVDDGLGLMPPRMDDGADLEERARTEKAVALEQVFRSRLSVLIGSAGTGKTTLLRMLCALPEVRGRGILLLAPTGKARVRLEEQTGQRGAGKTLAQFLNRLKRYDGQTNAYFPSAKAPKCGDYRTVIVDECSMLTEDQLAALSTRAPTLNAISWSAIRDSCRPSVLAGRSSTS